jgi:hypothetical protein
MRAWTPGQGLQLSTLSIAKPYDVGAGTHTLHGAARASERWPQLADVTVRYHGEFAYVVGHLLDGTTLPLCGLRYAGSATT